MLFAKKQTLLSLLLICCLAFLSACGGANHSGTSPKTDTNSNTNTGSSDSSSEEVKDGNIVLGVTIDMFNDKYQNYVRESMEGFLKSQNNVEAVFVDAMNDASRQLSQVETFIAQGVDAIVIVPVDPISVQDMVDRAEKANIPIILSIMSFDGIENTSAIYVGSKSIDSGLMQMEEVAKLLNGKGNVAIMNGGLGHEIQIARTEGNKQIIAQHPDMEIVLEDTGNWARAEALSLMENWLNTDQKIDAVIANNDEMAIGAMMAAQALGKEDEIIFAGIDATPDALEFMKTGELDVTVFQDAKKMGEESIRIAIEAGAGKEVEQMNLIPYELVTKDNYQEYLDKY